MQIINIKEKLAQINDHWNPRVVAELNGQHIRLVKIIGDEFDYHTHDDEDEMFLVIEGVLKLDFKDKVVNVNEGEFVIVSKGVLHRPVAKSEVHLMMFVTNKNVNTGEIRNKFTLDSLEKL